MPNLTHSAVIEVWKDFGKHRAYDTLASVTAHGLRAVLVAPWYLTMQVRGQKDFHL